ncbi:MAG: insulinase family protein [Labilithrix sp.]|nr:insulinase family protein [Labilithrix sp.]
MRSFAPGFSALTAAVVCLSCVAATPATYGPRKVDIPVSDGRPPKKGETEGAARQSPPTSGAAKQSPFPAVARAKLANGMSVAVVSSKTLPIVQLRLVVRAGSGFGPSPAVATLTGDMLKDGGTRAMSSAELLRRVETLGSDLSVSTDFDATVIAMPVIKDQLPEALSLLSQVVREPRFDGEELKKLKARSADAAEDAARSSGGFTATRTIFKELFPEKSAYATFGNTPAEIAKVDGNAVREFHRRFYVPKATTLVLAGDVDEPTAKALAERHFGAWQGGEPPKVAAPGPKLPPKMRVVVAHRPKSVQSDVYVAMLAPPRKAPGWAQVRVANQILGGGVASRLFMDVREQRSLAYRTSAQVLELASGEQPLVAYAGTQTEKTGQAIQGLLENLAKMTTSPPTQAETEAARRYLSDIFAVRMETIGSIADMVVTQETFGLPDGYWDAYRREIRATEPDAALAAAKALYTPDRALVVVAGDADVIGPELAKLGDVTVVDPEKEFATLKTIPKAER